MRLVIILSFVDNADFVAFWIGKTNFLDFAHIADRKTALRPYVDVAFANGFDGALYVFLSSRLFKIFKPSGRQVIFAGAELKCCPDNSNYNVILRLSKASPRNVANSVVLIR